MLVFHNAKATLKRDGYDIPWETKLLTLGEIMGNNQLMHVYTQTVMDT